MANSNTPKAKVPKTITINGHTWSPAVVKQTILDSDKAVKAALLRIYSFQTAGEQQQQETHETNGKGFNGTDAEILSSFSVQLTTKGWLSPKQLAIARKRLSKYSRQIYNHIVEQRQQTYSNFGV